VKLNGCVPGRRCAWNGLLAISLLLAVTAMALYLSVGARLSPITASGPWGSGLFSHGAGSRASGTRQILAFGNLPLSFEPNMGQSDPRVKFLSRGAGYGLFLTSDEAVLALRTKLESGNSVVRMKLAGANPAAEAVGADELRARSNYLIGNDPSRWQRNVPQFARVRYREIYAGIDLVYYGNQGRLEYDFEVAPGADPGKIQLHLAGSSDISLDAAGDLVLKTQGGRVTLHAPVVYQMVESERRPVPGRFVLTADHQVSFALGGYDRSRTLVIDPVLTYSSYLGGSGNEGCQQILGTVTPGCPAIAVDPSFNIYVAGPTTSPDFPTAGTPLQGTLATAPDVFVSKFDPTGSALVFSTYLGGSGTETTAGIAVDAASNVLVAGTTDSTNFPTMNGFQDSPPASSGQNVFLTQLKSDGSALLYSTYLAGTGADVATGMAIDNKGNAYVTGVTTPSGTPDFPTTAGAFQTTPLSTTDPEFFLSMVKPSASGAASLVFSTYFGGGNPATGAAVIGGGVATDTNGNVYITGGTNFQHLGDPATDFPILNAGQPCLNVPEVATPPSPPPACPASTNTDAFVAKFNPAAGTGAQLVYSTYLGGSGADAGHGIAVDAGSNAYVTGETTSGDVFVPSGETPFQTGNGGNTDAFLAKLSNPAANAIVTLSYFSYVGGSGTDKGFAVGVDPSASSTQQARVVGSTTSGDLPHASRSNAGGTDAFMARVDTTASATVNNNSSIYIGGTGTDNGTAVAVDSNTITYVAGDTNSGSAFPIAGSAFQTALSGASDAFISKVGLTSDLAITGVTTSVTTIGAGNPVTFTYALKNNGPDPTPGVTFTADLPASGSGATFTSISPSTGNCGTATGGKILCSLGTLSNGGTATVAVVLTPSSGATSLISSGTVSVSPSSSAPSTDPNVANNSSGTSVPVTDFSVTPNPSTQTVVAGNSATYQVEVTPLPTYGNKVSLSCSAGLPQGTACNFSTNPVSLPSTTPVSSTLTITTTARPVTTSSLRSGSGLWYALLLPVAGLALVGLGAGRQHRKLMGLLLGLVLGGVLFQAACGGGTSTPPTTGGTPAGTYTVTVTGTSGSASHASTVTLVVQ
jgi:uncharacterized protein DUF11/beta-propeller repeat-containing protein